MGNIASSWPDVPVTAVAILPSGDEMMLSNAGVPPERLGVLRRERHQSSREPAPYVCRLKT